MTSKHLEIGKSYAVATRTPETRQSPNATTPKLSFLPTHCLVSPTFEHRQQPRRKGKDRSLRAYDACPQRIKKKDLHVSRTKRETLARHNSRYEPPRELPRDPVEHLMKRVCPMLDKSEEPDFLRPMPSETRHRPKPQKVRKDWSKARKCVMPKHESRCRAEALRRNGIDDSQLAVETFRRRTAVRCCPWVQ